METLGDYLGAWEADYAERSRAIPLFAEGNWPLIRPQLRLFIRLFYHARGHFLRFLGIMANYAPSHEYRSVVLSNIMDELGGLNPDDLPHEQLFFRFAERFEPDIRTEARTERTYVPFLKMFNEGHFDALMNADWDEKWSLFAAYELLDNVDYANLARLAMLIGACGDELAFFNVHLNSTHFSDTAQLLGSVWDKDSRIVRRSFTFIGQHQLDMWQALSRKIFD